MAAYDVKREMKALYAPRNTGWELVEVPGQRFATVDGEGDPNTSEAYAEAVEALYTVAYTARAAVKADGGRVFTVAPLEGLWWSDDPAVFTARDKDSWRWTMMIGLPEWVGEDGVAEARERAFAKKGLRAIERVASKSLEEGLCAQALHVGSYDDEGPVLADLHSRFMPERGLTFNGPHHEVYIGDPRRVEPAKLRTVLRQPVRRAP